MSSLPCVLTIAGSDSGGGAGIQADLKTMTMLGGFGMSVITSLTSQNSLGVDDIHAPAPEFVVKQYNAVTSDFPVAAAKTGMLFSRGIIEALCTRLSERDFPLVVDPVCVSQSGHRLLQEDAVDAIREHLIPLADIFTPNRPEAELLAGMSICSDEDIQQAIAKLLDMGAKAVLLKGGHFDGERMVDWLGVKGQDPIAIEQQYIETKNTHGTGCTLSAAIATGLAKGLGVEDAVLEAQSFLNSALAASFTPGHGCGPANHSVELMRLQAQDACGAELARLADILDVEDTPFVDAGLSVEAVAVSLPWARKTEHVLRYALSHTEIEAEQSSRFRYPEKGGDELIAEIAHTATVLYPEGAFVCELCADSEVMNELVALKEESSELGTDFFVECSEPTGEKTFSEKLRYRLTSGAEMVHVVCVPDSDGFTRLFVVEKTVEDVMRTLGALVTA
ncbi:bifunctional hydroxymethylpyrimidine kinase/phosphomethylpyrimidine kinase [Desulfobaculum bizertense]|uniref:bifunctional hydroxymethylpyrimidine kinase/phosphomethylpyrimidine kinase n=1 Tax=Desulfobaculum bizertense TaxID=376490 RepID=UPI0032B79EA0